MGAFGVFALTAPAFAQELGFVAGTLAYIASIIIELAGKLLIVMIDLLLVIVAYNDFLMAPAVTRGWILMRDFANMAFLVIFIAIAYATILGVEKYEWKRLLPKLLMVAVVINFSKTISGLIIDASQVIMITFVNGFKDVAAGNLVNGLGLSQMLSYREFAADESITDTAVAVASILAVILLVIAVMVVGTIVLMFLIRIMYLWILIVLAPLAFLMAATPGAEHLFKEWWNKLVRYAFVGPIMAFWLWLSFSVMAGVAPGQNLAQQHGFYQAEGETGFFDVSGNTAAAISGISRSDQLLSYGISIALLIYSLMVARGMAIKGSGLAEGALSRIKSGGIKLGKLAALGVATGGVGSALGLAGAWKGGKKVAPTFGRFAGRRLDEKISPAVSKGLGQLGARIFGKTRLGLGAQRLAEQGILLRTAKQSWKERSESREKNVTAPYIGAGRDVLHKVIDNKDTNYKFRHVMALANEEAKKQREESDNTSEAFLEPVYRVAQSGHAQNTKETKGALINVWGQNDQNEVTLSTARFNDERDIGEEIHRRVIEKFEQVLTSEGRARADAYLGLQEKLEQAVEEGAPDEEIFGIKKDLNHAREILRPLELQYAEHKPQTATDSPFARVEAMKMLLGESDEAKQFASRLSGVALENKNFAGFALAGFDADSGKYDFADLYSEEGFKTYNNNVMGKMRNINPPDLWRTHPSGLRNEIRDKNGMRTYAADLNTVGQNLVLLAAPGISERNLNLRPDASGALMGGVAPREYPNMYDPNIESRSRAQRDYVEDNMLGYAYSFSPRISQEAKTRTVSQYMQRQGATREDIQKTPRQLLQEQRNKLTQIKSALEASRAALGQAVDPAEQARLNEETNGLAQDVNRITKQISRFVENVDERTLDVKLSTAVASEENGGNGSSESASPNPPQQPSPEASAGPSIVLPGSPEFRASDPQSRDFRGRRPQA